MNCNHITGGKASGNVCSLRKVFTINKMCVDALHNPRRTSNAVNVNVAVCVCVCTLDQANKQWLRWMVIRLLLICDGRVRQRTTHDCMVYEGWSLRSTTDHTFSRKREIDEWIYTRSLLIHKPLRSFIIDSPWLYTRRITFVRQLFTALGQQTIVSHYRIKVIQWFTWNLNKRLSDVVIRIKC